MHVLGSCEASAQYSPVNVFVNLFHRKYSNLPHCFSDLIHTEYRKLHKNNGHSPVFLPPIMRSSEGLCRNIRYRQLYATRDYHQCIKMLTHEVSEEPVLVDKVLALHAGCRGFDSHRGHMVKRFFRSNRPGYPHPVSSELENSGIRVGSVIAVSLNVGGGVRLIKPAKLHVHAKHYKHNEDGCTAPGVCGNGSVPLSHSGNVVTRIGIHTQHVKYYSTVVKVVIITNLEQKQKSA